MTKIEFVPGTEPKICELCNQDISGELSILDHTTDGNSRTIGFCCHELLTNNNEASIPDSMQPVELAAIIEQLHHSKQGVQLELESADLDGNSYSLNCPGATQLRPTAGSYTDGQIIDTAQRVPYREWPDSVKRLATEVKRQSSGSEKLVLYMWPDGVITAFHVVRNQKCASTDKLVFCNRKAAPHFSYGGTHQ